MGAMPRRSLGTILGGEPPPGEEELLSVQALRACIEAASDTPTDYDAGCLLIAKLVLAHLQRHPEHADLTAAGQYEWVAGNADRESEFRKVGPSIFDVLPAADQQRIDDLGPTGFMVGWAVNAARRCLELPPVANPAILEL